MRTLDQTFNTIDFEGQMLSRDGYDNCEFINCTFTNVDFADVSFMECTFKICDFSSSRLDNAGIKDVNFVECNFLGVDLSVCSPFLWKARFDDCQMDLIIASGMKLKGMEFTNCSLKEADFTEADLTSASFDGCNLERAIFQQSNLEKTDFRTAINYSFEPGNNILKKTQFSTSGIMGLLSSYDIVVSP